MQEVAPDDSAEPAAFQELLRVIAEVLDIRSVFPRVSEIANTALPHDAMAMMFYDEHGHMAFEGRSTADFPDIQPHVIGARRSPDERIIDDLTSERLGGSGPEGAAHERTA